MEKKYDYLIVGAGLFGAVFAREARLAGKRCLVVDKRPHAGGNLYCQQIEGVNVHRYGAHIFHTDNKRVWDYVNALVEFNRFTNSPMACFEGKFYNLPFNMNTFNRLWGVRTPDEARAEIERQRGVYAGIEEPANLEEQALKLAGEDIYRILVKGYTEKQWGRSATELPAFIIRRLPFRFTYDNNYFNDPYQGIPIGGYNVLTDALLEGVEVSLETDYFADRAALDALAEKVVFTGCIDEYFDYSLGRLEYRSLRFEDEMPDTDNYQGVAVVNYTEREIPYTRVIEHKHFEFGTQPRTVITREYPAAFTGGNEPYYPVNDAANSALYTRYKALADAAPNVLFGGRLGQYAYFDMDDTVESALAMAERELGTVSA